MPRDKETPSHQTEVYLPGGITLRYGSRPSGKFKGRGYCKYCYKTHCDWWQMQFKDYGDDVVLCGKCEYTHLKSFVFGKKGKNDAAK